MNIWQFQNLISRRLLNWALGSIILGFFMRFGGKFWKSLGNQFITWGAIDAAIAVGGQIAANQRIDKLENPGKAEVKQTEAKNLSRLLWINAVLDVFYILGGLWWASRDKGDGTSHGNGLGVVIQGLFLLIFDTFHALKTPKNHEEE